jgi:hypothetical protein
VRHPPPAAVSQRRNRPGEQHAADEYPEDSQREDPA